MRIRKEGADLPNGILEEDLALDPEVVQLHTLLKADRGNEDCHGEDEQQDCADVVMGLEEDLVQLWVIDVPVVAREGAKDEGKHSGGRHVDDGKRVSHRARERERTHSAFLINWPRAGERVLQRGRAVSRGRKQLWKQRLVITGGR